LRRLECADGRQARRDWSEGALGEVADQRAHTVAVRAVRVAERALGERAISSAGCGPPCIATLGAKNTDT